TYSRGGLELWSEKTGQLHGQPTGVPGHIPGAFSPDGRFLVQWQGRKVQVWETRTGRALGPPLRLPHAVLYAELSNHGTLLATLPRPPDRVELWDAISKRPRGEPARHPTSEGFFEFSPDERLLVTAEGGYLHLWDTPTGQLHLSVRVAAAPAWV